jgi:hypothetical protein
MQRLFKQAGWGSRKQPPLLWNASHQLCEAPETNQKIPHLPNLKRFGGFKKDAADREARRG